MSSETARDSKPSSDHSAQMAELAGAVLGGGSGGGGAPSSAKYSFSDAIHFSDELKVGA